jgi:cephalosporin-C deacetylase-like acetyl esterase
VQFTKSIIRNCGALVRVCAFIFIFVVGFNQSARAQQPGQSGAAQATPAKPDATEDSAAGDKGSSLPPSFDPVKRIPLYETIQEDWSSLSVGVSQLTPEPPLEAQTDEGEGFTRTLVQLKWRPGDPLDLYVILPKGAKKPPAVLYLYGYKDDTDRFRDDRWCERVTSGGYAAIGFVSALTGQRFHDRPMRQWFVSELQESLGSTVHDVKFILDYLAKRGDVDMNRIGMFGQSSGGAIALLAAAADPRIKAVDVLDPWGDWPIWLKKSPVALDDPDHATMFNDEFLKKVAPLDPVKWLPTLQSTHIRVQQVMDNVATPNECKDALKEAAPKQADVVRYEHVNQFADAAGQGKLFDWIKVQLKVSPISAAQKRTAVAERVAPASQKTSSAGTQR